MGLLDSIKNKFGGNSNAASSSAVSDSSSNQEKPEGSTDWSKYKVLIAEDEQELREILVEKLNEEGFQVFQSANGEECIQLAFKERPDVILLDLYMPKSTGFDVLDKLMDDEWGREAKVIVLTNRGDFTSKQKVLKLRHLSYLIKAETGLDELVKIIKDKLAVVDDVQPIV